MKKPRHISPEKLNQRIAALRKDHAEADARLVELCATPVSRAVNKDKIQEQKDIKCYCLREISIAEEKIAKLAADAASKKAAAAEHASKAREAIPLTPTAEEETREAA